MSLSLYRCTPVIVSPVPIVTVTASSVSSSRKSVRTAPRSSAPVLVIVNCPPVSVSSEAQTVDRETERLTVFEERGVIPSSLYTVPVTVVVGALKVQFVLFPAFVLVFPAASVAPPDASLSCTFKYESDCVPALPSRSNFAALPVFVDLKLRSCPAAPFKVSAPLTDCLLL